MPSLTSGSDFRRWLVLAVALGGWIAPAVAHALPTDADRATARALAREGYEAQQRGAYAVAAERFSRAEELVDAPTLLLGLAHAQVGLGKLVEAEETYQRILRRGLAPGDPAPFARALGTARAEVTTLASRIAWITLEVHGPPAPSVSIDGEAPLAPAALGVARPFDPGPHTVDVRAEGFMPVEQTFRVVESETRTIVLVAVPAAAPAERQTEVSEAPEGTPFGRAAGIAALGLGAAGLVVGGVAGVLVLRQHAELSQVCSDGQCSPNESHDVATYHALADVSTASIAAGAALAVTGTVLLLTTRKGASVKAYAGFLRAGVGGTF